MTVRHHPRICLRIDNLTIRFKDTNSTPRLFVPSSPSGKLPAPS
uniref:Uncharacterized protein n=1 Tax=Ustilago esculenta TaxID=185366 RepID=A0A481SFG2_9BASI|nr:hypothetical protein UE_1389 [Ustilago esculenta]